MGAGVGFREGGRTDGSWGIPRMTDAEIVSLLARQYKGERFDYTEETGGIYWSLVSGSPDLILCRGSVNPQDWMRDFESELGRALPGWSRLGLLPDGFSRGLEETLAAFDSRTEHVSRRHLVLAGHSLGAAHAAELAGMFVSSGDLIDRLVLCGCPRPGTKALAGLFDPKIIASYRNRSDPVCDVPVAIEPLLPWCPLGSYLMLDEAPAQDDSWGPLAEHHIELYEAGVARMTER